MQQSETLPPNPTHHLLKDLTGQVFGNLSVLSRAGSYKNNGSAECTWSVQCTKCGFTYPKPIRGSFLRGGRATGKKCAGCRGDRSKAPFLIIDKAFMEKWTPLLCASIGKIIGFGRTFAEHKDDLLQEVWIQLAKFRGDVPTAALSTFIWQFGKRNAINLLKKTANAKHHPTIAAADEESYCFVLDNLTDAAADAVFSTPEADAFAELSQEEQAFCRAYFYDTTFKNKADRERANAIRQQLIERVEELKSGESNSTQEADDSR